MAGVELAKLRVAADADDVGDGAFANGVEAEGRYAGEFADAAESVPEGVDVEALAGDDAAPEPYGVGGHGVEPHLDHAGGFVEEADAGGAGFAAGDDGLVDDAAAV